MQCPDSTSRQRCNLLTLATDLCPPMHLQGPMPDSQTQGGRRQNGPIHQLIKLATSAASGSSGVRHAPNLSIRMHCDPYERPRSCRWASFFITMHVHASSLNSRVQGQHCLPFSCCMLKIRQHPGYLALTVYRVASTRTGL